MEYLRSIYLPTFGESCRFWRQNQRIWYCSKQLKSILTKTVAASFISELKCHDYYFLLFLLKKTWFWSVEYFWHSPKKSAKIFPLFFPEKTYLSLCHKKCFCPTFLITSQNIFSSLHYIFCFVVFFFFPPFFSMTSTQTAQESQNVSENVIFKKLATGTDFVAARCSVTGFSLYIS